MRMVAEGYVSGRGCESATCLHVTVTNGRERKRTRSCFEMGQRSWEIVSKAVRLAQRAKSITPNTGNTGQESQEDRRRHRDV